MLVEVAKINEITALKFLFMQKVFDMGFSILKTYPVRAFPPSIYKHTRNEIKTRARCALVLLLRIVFA